MLKKEVVDLYFGLFERGFLPKIYSKISYTHRTEIVQNLHQEQESDSSKTHDVYWVKYVPTYLKPCLKKPLKAINFFEIKGYAITINGVSNIGEYLNDQMKPKLKKSILNRKSRLESCFDISYEVIINQISKERFSRLMADLRRFLVRRFQQRNEVNERLCEWDKFHNLFFDLINTGKASLFVIFDDRTPIALSLNYHLDRIFFGAISSYDIDYSKFGLGQLLVYKRLEWSINSGFDIFDLSMGNPIYKMKWCNLVYNFEHWIVYNPNSLKSTMKAKILAILMGFKNYLKSKNVHLLYHKILKKLKFRHRSKNKLVDNRTYTKGNMENVHNLQEFKDLKKINFTKDSFLFLKRFINEFLYTTKDHISNIEVFEVTHKKEYLIKGPNKIKKVKFYS